MLHETIAIANSSAIQTHCNGASTLMLMEHIIWNDIVLFFWTNRKYVVIGACLNLNVSLLGVRCTLTHSQLHNRLLLKYTAMVMMAYGAALILLEYMERRYVDFERTESTLVLVHVLNVLLVSIRYTMRNDCIKIARPPSIQLPLQYHMTRRWCWYWTWLNVWNGIMLALGEQEVRWYWCMFEFKSLFCMRCTIQSSQLQIRLLFNYIVNNLWFCADVGWIYGMQSRRCWANSMYVSIGACLNLNVPLLLDTSVRILCNMTRLQLHTRSVAIQLQWHMSPGRCSCWLNMQRYCVDFERTDSMYVDIGTCLNLNVSLLGMMHYITPPQLHTDLLFNYNGNDLWFCADVDWMCATVSFRLWMNRKYVACLNLNVLLLGIRCTI